MPAAPFDTRDRHLAFALPGCLCLLVAAGCEERGITEREVQKGSERIAEVSESRSGRGAQAGADAEAAETSGGDAVSWSVPPNWRRVEEQAPMRFATFVAEHGEAGGEAEVESKVTISRFPGDVGGELANVNRWRRQVGLGPIGEAELDEIVARFGSPGRAGYRVRIEGEGSILLAAGLHEAARDRTWFVKSVVSSSSVADALEREIEDFAASIGGEAPRAEME